MHSYFKPLRPLIVSVGLISTSIGAANAAVIFSQVGEDLLITLDQPIVFFATEVGVATTPSLSYIVIFEDVFSTPVTGTTGAFSTDPDLTMSIFGGPSSYNSAAGQNPAPFNERDSTDLSISFVFAVATSIAHNQKVTIEAGTMRNVGYFSFSRGNLPDQAPTEIILVSSQNVLMGGAVPEPSTSLLLTLGGIGLVSRRKR